MKSAKKMGILSSIFFLILSIRTFNQFVAAKNQLQTNFLNSTSTPVSNGGTFTLDFFTNRFTSFTYLGIWYANLKSDHKVWVANRDTPMIGGGVLMIDESGTLKVVNSNGITLFNVSTQISSKNTIAVLEDSGNFVVKDSTSNQNLWQSFDHPTDTLLPGMKLGYNLTTKQNWTLTSWFSDQIPATGDFTLSLEQYRNSPQLLIYRLGELYWASGPWQKDNGTFQFLNFRYNLSLISDASGIILTSKENASSSSTLQLSYKGQLIDGTNRLLTPEFCYRYQGDNGCAVSASLPNCRGENDSFKFKSGDWLNGSSNYDSDSSISFNDCRERCWNECNCLGFVTNSNGTGCITYAGDMLFRDDNSGAKYYVLVSSNTPPKTKDALIPGDELNGFNTTSILVSAFKRFSMGFFTNPFTNFTYLGIWYTNLESYPKVWVANRDTPIINGTGVLMMDESGTVKVINRDSRSILFNVFYNQAGSSYNTKAMLQDSGNFLIYDVTNNRTLWQSFDHPTDTLLPGMKLGYNLTTKQNWTLTSWFSDQSPATGSFTMMLKQYQNSPQLLIYRRGELYRASDPWKNGTFKKFNASGSMYVTYREVEYNLRLNPNGQISVNGSSNVDQIFCYGYQSDDGCVVFALPQCRSRKYSFELKSGDWINWSSNNDTNSSTNLNGCMERCWNDCNCVGFSTINSDGTGCRTWIKKHNHLKFSEDTFGNTDRKYVLVSKKPPEIKTWMWIVISLAIALTSVSGAYLCYVRIRRRRQAETEIWRRDDFIQQLTGSSSFNYGDELEKGIKDAPDIKIFSLKAILAATRDFSNENILGQGGYGPVYKGELFDGRKIAVKRLSKTSSQGILEFKSELILISKLQHTNLVRLYGCCINQEENMLIYELMHNKSLDFFLFDEDKKIEIDWRNRFSIIEGIAQGLLYLHKYSRMKVIHRDLKASNILLDENMNPKIADFGMARIFQHNVSQTMTNKVAGTYGYMAPEYAMHGTFSTKSDVFSFGVLILEIISGKKNSSLYKYDMLLSLVGYTWELWKREETLELKDGALGESYDTQQLLRCIHVSLLCVQENANDRPTMSEVISMLNNENQDLPIPKRPAFSTRSNDVQSSKPFEHLLGNNIQVSANNLTFSTLEPR